MKRLRLRLGGLPRSNGGQTGVKKWSNGAFASAVYHGPGSTLCSTDRSGPEYWSNTGQTLSENWPNHIRKLVKSYPNTGQILVKYRRLRSQQHPPGDRLLPADGPHPARTLTSV